MEKKSVLDTSVNWFVAVLVIGMRQYHYILQLCRAAGDLCFYCKPEGEGGSAAHVSYVDTQDGGFMVEPLKHVLLMVVGSSRRDRAGTS